MEKKIIGRECKSVQHLMRNQDRPDTHIIKEVIHYEDGTTEPKLRTLYNYKRPYWVTKEHRRNHKDKKESETIDNLVKYTATTSDLNRAVASRLGYSYVGKTDRRSISKSPYVYGLDVSSSTMIKDKYMKTYPGLVSKNVVCNLDIELNVKTNEIIVITINTKEKLYTVILDSLIKGYDDVEKQLNYLYNEYIPKTDITGGMKREYEIFDNELDMIKAIFKRVHEWKPDIVAAWNISYDMGKILAVLERHGVDPKDIFSDPALPPELRHFKFKEGRTHSVTESGKYKPINIHEQWHVYETTSYFKFLDAMAVYWFVRVGGKLVPGGYGLDNILRYVLGDKLGKLKFKDEVNIVAGTLDWHNYMVANKPLEYIIYNNWDNMSMTHLDEKTNDLNSVAAMLLGVSDYSIFNSGPKRIIDALHFFYLDRGLVLGTKDMTSGDQEHLGLGGWIVLLPAYRIKENGLQLLEGSDIHSNARGHTYDAD